MFWENFKKMCDENNKSPTQVVVDLGLSRSLVTSWKNGNLPRPKTIKMIADYFGVSIPHFLEVKALEQQSEPKLSEQEIQSINKDRDMTPMEAWWIISSNLMELYKCKRTETFKGYTDADLEAEVLCFKALSEMYERSEEK